MTERFVVSHGWQYAWCDPKEIGKYSIRECVKGPFAKPKFAYPVPFVTYCQTDSNGGPPQCWVEPVSDGADLGNPLLEGSDPMYRKYVDMISPPRRNCVVAGQDLGQGIPDPWKSSPYAKNLKISRQFPFGDLLELKKNMSLLLRKSQQNQYKEPCFCCEKKYLFECPDRSNVCAPRDRRYLNCSCLDCHKRSPRRESEKKCHCLYRNQMLQDSRESCGKNMESDCSKTSSEIGNENLVCTCGQNQRSDPTFETNPTSGGNTNEEKSKPKKNKHSNEFPRPTVMNVWYSQTRNNLENGPTEKKVSIYPYVKNYERRKDENNNNDDMKNLAQGTEIPKANAIISKEVQTEVSNEFNLKNKETWIQMENDRFQRKCSTCSDHKRKEKSKTKAVPPNSCFAYYMNQNLGSVCPYSYANHFVNQNPQCQRAKIKKKKKRGKKGEEESEDGSWSNFSPKKEKKHRSEPVKSKYRNWTFKYDPERSDNKVGDSRENHCNFQPLVVPFDHMKLIAENKLKNYIDRKKMSADTVNSKFYPHSNSSHMPSRYRDIFEERGGWGDRDMERCKQSYPFKRISRGKFLQSSRDEKRFLSSKISHRKTLSDSGVQVNMASGRGESSSKVSTKNLKEICESDEAYGVARESSTKGSRRRKRLARSRRRRRKLVGRRSLVFAKPPPKRNTKSTQADDTGGSEMDQNNLSPKKIYGLSEHNRKIPEILNPYHSLKHSNSSGNSYLKLYPSAHVGTLSRIREEVFKNRSDSYDSRSRQSEVDEVLEKISSNRRNAWSSPKATMVGDLQFKKRPGRAH